MGSPYYKAPDEFGVRRVFKWGLYEEVDSGAIGMMVVIQRMISSNNNISGMMMFPSHWNTEVIINKE